MHGVAVDRAVLAEPCVVHKIRHVDDHRIAFPVANRVSVVRWIERPVMVPAIRRDHAKGVLFGRVDRIVDEDDLIGNLNDFGWRTYARIILWRTLKRRVLMLFPFTTLFRSRSTRAAGPARG